MVCEEQKCHWYWVNKTSEAISRIFGSISIDESFEAIPVEVEKIKKGSVFQVT